MIAIAGALLMLAGAWFYPNQAAHAYWWAYQLTLGCSLGALAVLMIHHLVGGGWGGVIRRPLEAAVGVLPWLAAAFVPAVLAKPLLVASGGYFVTPAFLVRAVAYFVVWIGLGWRLRQPGEHAAASAAGLVLYMLTTFFAAVDWIMALEPGWTSTAIGLIYAAGQVELGFAAGILGLAALPPEARQLKAQHLNDLGNLLLAGTMTWAYLAYAQYLVVWAGNLRADVPWYVHRSGGGWQAVIVALVALGFVLPFGVLLFRLPKRHLRGLSLVAAVVMLGQAAHLFWQILPAVAPYPRVTWLELAALTALGGLWLWAYARCLAARPLEPPPDEPIEETPEHVY